MSQETLITARRAYKTVGTFNFMTGSGFAKPEVRTGLVLNLDVKVEALDFARSLGRTKAGRIKALRDMLLNAVDDGVNKRDLMLIRVALKTLDPTFDSWIKNVLLPRESKILTKLSTLKFRKGRSK